ncbi:ActS/PrrB/RegB family redox-sensitive histidine kinase [Salaquimonas pukyongi]|uniref:ActS/PrrB/RegB family redox-sensitive histidine kinase n=1 Tax=Salaquimonas pukyongi TaxID=2712698 RepID=UPI003D1681DF
MLQRNRMLTETSTSPGNGDSLAVRLNTTIRIRWLAIVGQTVAVLFIHFVMGFDMLLLPCLLVIAMSAWLNLFLRVRYPGNVRWRGPAVMGLLAYDILQLASLLYLTGGIQNPFSILLVVPVIVSAATQRAKYTALLFVLALAATSLLVFFHQPLPWFEPGGIVLPLEIKAGIWVAIASTMAFTAVYMFRMADESRKLADALAATELVLQREQHISNLDGLAAAAAHELGTPLATISLVTKEMLREAETGSSLKEDMELLHSQADRCREILRKISTLSSEEDENITTLSIGVLLEEVAAPYRLGDAVIDIRLEGEPPLPVARRNAAIIYGLGNLLENAVDFAETRVTFSASWNQQKVAITISDDGKGFSPAVLEHIGEPFISHHSASHMDTGGGLGLGLFIAKTLLERSGAMLTFRNKPAKGGAAVEVVWNRADFEQASPKSAQ